MISRQQGSHLDEASRAMGKAGQAIKGLRNTTAPENRGDYLQITTGISHGIGRRCPMNIRSPSRTAEATAKLLSDVAVQLRSAVRQPVSLRADHSLHTQT